MVARIREILSWYQGENPGVLGNLARMLMHGTLGGTGRMVILPVDQGFEHGPARSFAPNPAGYDPAYHFELAIEAGCSAYAAPPGQLGAVAAQFAGMIPAIVKVNSGDVLFSTKNPVPAVTCSVQEALRLGASAIGFTIYPGSEFRKDMYEEVSALIEEARSVGLPTVIWSYPRGEGISKDGETALDVVSYAAQIACQLGAHIVKVKPPTDHLEQPEARKVYEKYSIKSASLADRVRHVIQSSFNGRRIVIFSGGAAKTDDEVLSEVAQLAAGGAFGSIMGRNSFQRPRAEGVSLLKKVMAAFAENA